MQALLFREALLHLSQGLVDLTTDANENSDGVSSAQMSNKIKTHKPSSFFLHAVCCFEKIIPRKVHEICGASCNRKGCCVGCLPLLAYCPGGKGSLGGRQIRRNPSAQHEDGS